MNDSALFQKMSEQEVSAALKALSAREVPYPKESPILAAGETTEKMGLVLAGSVTIESTDLWGNRTILSHVGPGEFFAETYALLGEILLVDAVANEDCRVRFFRVSRLADYAGEPWAAKLTANLLVISARKNLALSGRSFHTAPKTVRGRLMAYLNTVSLQSHSREFTIPFDRQQLADYLNLDRSALSKELGKMRDEGILETRKNWFVLKGRESTDENFFQE